MLTKPEKGQMLLLMAYSQVSRAAFSVEVECIGADSDDVFLLSAASRTAPRKRRKVMVMFPDGRVIDVTRADVEPAVGE